MPQAPTVLQVSRDHPRPQLQREAWISLDGDWEFAFDRDASSWPGSVTFDRTIRVPFAPETPLSGIGDERYTQAVWYRRRFAPPPLARGQRLMLRFGAVDCEAAVWVNGGLAGTHDGGYTPFSLDITDLLAGGESDEVVVRAADDPHDLARPRGKQDWKPEPHAIWYPRTTGIWQTVWLERGPALRIEALRWTCSLDRGEIGLEAGIGGGRREGLALEVTLSAGTGAGRRTLASERYSVVAGEVRRRIGLPDPGIDSGRNDLLWSPGSPTLIEAELRLVGPDGAVLDEVASYTAMREVRVDGDRFLLNGRPFYLRLALDQGYWPESGLTAPSVDALRRDVELAREMGLNGVRKHQKVEDPRYLHWADRIGLLVWAEMPSAYRFGRRSAERIAREWADAVLRDASHPCIVAWVPVNESWGVPDLPASREQRDFVAALYYLTRSLDPTRPVVGNDGWEMAATDLVCIHDYDGDPAVLEARYGAGMDPDLLLRRERPLGRRLLLEGEEYRGQPLILSEFGGIAYEPGPAGEGAWGYSRAGSDAAFAAHFTAMLEAVRRCPRLAGFCYTQFADTYQEVNGLLRADRTPKLPLARLAAAISGAPRPQAVETGDGSGFA
ncbi:MAG: glycoside hydrolase family 2 protein [Chloroflexota bacterium]